MNIEERSAIDRFNHGLPFYAMQREFFREQDPADVGEQERAAATLHLLAEMGW